MTSPIAGDREAKEREAFEAWRRRTTKMDPDGAVALRGFGKYPGYDNTYTRCMHMAWMARAALLEPVGEGWVSVEERKPHRQGAIMSSSDDLVAKIDTLLAKYDTYKRSLATGSDAWEDHLRAYQEARAALTQRLVVLTDTAQPWTLEHLRAYPTDALAILNKLGAKR